MQVALEDGSCWQAATFYLADDVFEGQIFLPQVEVCNVPDGLKRTGCFTSLWQQFLQPLQLSCKTIA